MIEITTGLLMLVSAFSQNAGKTVEVVEASEVNEAEITAVEAVVPAQFAIPMAAPLINMISTTTKPLTIAETEWIVKEYFSETPILAEIARCESSFRHFDKNGDVLRGVQNNSDIGVMQINKFYHLEDAEKLGFDIYTIQGNLEYAKVLYGKYGARPWVHSSKCWGQTFPSHVAQK